MTKLNAAPPIVITKEELIKKCCFDSSFTRILRFVFACILTFIIWCVFGIVLGIPTNILYGKYYDLNYNIFTGIYTYEDGSPYKNHCSTTNDCCNFTAFGILIGCPIVACEVVGVVLAILGATLLIGFVVLMSYTKVMEWLEESREKLLYEKQIEAKNAACAV